MNDKNLEFIKYLSKRDKKTLSQKALKSSEEVGELSKAILSFDNAYATMHRFIPKKKILEEVVDVMLTTMSIAYELDFTDEDIEEMMLLKATKWLELQDKQDGVNNMIPYEMHVTISTIENIQKFKDDCVEIGVKPILLELENGANRMKDFQTSSNYFGNNRGVYEEIVRISDLLNEKGYEIIRKKIETIPWHPAAPRESDTYPNMPKNSYFESHISVVVTIDTKEKLEIIAKNNNAHLSRNFFKKINDDEYINMITLRKYSGTYESFLNNLKILKEHLSISNFKYEKEIVEFALYDTKISHDLHWIK